MNEWYQILTARISCGRIDIGKALNAKSIKRKKASYKAGFRINEAATYSPGSNPSTIGAA
ncbi:MAG: hypothetical protein ACI8YP_003669, partial [Algoriphagus sp.]